ncbi:MAG: hypothetical protein NT027_12080 [Proteobacteria bacterium]|nr:hypothetical protein [Pseudomonadota bacterium]
MPTNRINIESALFFLLVLSIFPTNISYAESQFTLKPSMQLFLTATGQSIAESKINPKNETLKIDDRIVSIDLRPSLKLDEGQFQLIARPQLRSEVFSRTIDDKRQTEHSRSYSKWLEAYGNWNASDKVLVSYGIQNYQWGAAETVNPSNRLNHETIDGKGVTQATQGKNLMRLNVTWLKNLSSVFIGETKPVEDSPIFRAEEEFETKSVMKHEFSWNSGADYLGLVYGSGEVSLPWVGEYFNISLFDGLTLYGDASHQKGSAAWYPVEENSPLPTQKVVNLKQSKKDETKIYTFGVVGMRYSFEGGSDIRWEYMINNAGWTKEENDLGTRAIDSSIQLQLPNIKQNATRWAKPGLEYRGQKYVMISVRAPDFSNVKDLVIYLRALRSLQDLSTSGYSSVEYSFGDASTVFATFLGTKGQDDQELRGYVAASGSIGLRQDF